MQHHVTMQTNDRNDQNVSTSEFRESSNPTDSSATTAATSADPLHDLTAIQRDLLREVVAEGRPGLHIRDALVEHYDDDISHSRLYPNLQTLGDKGLVKKEEIDGRTNRYSATPRGRREFLAHLAWDLKAVTERDDEDEDIQQALDWLLDGTETPTPIADGIDVIPAGGIGESGGDAR